DDLYRGALERGASPEEAAAAARREIEDWDGLARAIIESDGGHRVTLDQRALERLEQCPAAGSRVLSILSDLAADVLHARRLLFKNPGFTAGVLITLALGIGANAAMFTILNAVVLRPLPYAEPDRLVNLWENNLKRGWPQFAVSQPNFLDWREQSVSFERLSATTPRAFNLTDGGGAEHI